MTGFQLILFNIFTRLRKRVRVSCTWDGRCDGNVEFLDFWGVKRNTIFTVNPNEPAWRCTNQLWSRSGWNGRTPAVWRTPAGRFQLASFQMHLNQCEISLNNWFPTISQQFPTCRLPNPFCPTVIFNVTIWRRVFNYLKEITNLYEYLVLLIA